MFIIIIIYLCNAQTLAKLTDRDINDIRAKMNLEKDSEPWLQKVWPFYSVFQIN